MKKSAVEICQALNAHAQDVVGENQIFHVLAKSDGETAMISLSEVELFCSHCMPREEMTYENMRQRLVFVAAQILAAFERDEDYDDPDDFDSDFDPGDKDYDPEEPEYRDDEDDVPPILGSL